MVEEPVSFDQLLQELQEKITLDKNLPAAAAITRRFAANTVDTLSAAFLTTASRLVNLSRGRFAPAMKSATLRTLAATARMSFLPVTTPDETMYEVQLLGPMRPEWAAKLKKHGLNIASYVPPFR